MTYKQHLFYNEFYDNSDEMRVMVINNPYNFKIVKVTKIFLKISGYTEEEAYDLPSMQSLYHPDCYEALEQARILYLKQGFLHECELAFKAKNGNKIPVYLNILATKDKDGNILFNHCLYREVGDDANNRIYKITQEQQYLTSLNNSFTESHAFYQYFYDFYENAPDMFASFTGGKDEDIATIGLTNCNNALAQKLGYTKEEILSLNVYNLYHPDCLPEVRRLRQHILKHGCINNAELQLQKRNGDKVYVSLNAKVQKDSQGNIIGGVSMWRDIADLVETRCQLQETNNLLTLHNEEIKTLMNLMSHDIQAPIRAIENFTQFILEESEKLLPPSSLNYLYKVRANVHKLHHLSQDILSYFFGGSAASIEETTLTDIINQVVTYLDLPSAIKISLENGSQPFKTKKILLSQVFYNLISNAVKYHHNPEKVEIYIKGLDNNTEWMFIVKDNGPGISQKFHETVFEPLKRLQNDQKVEGNGIGLTIVKKIITQEGGKISLGSQEGEGAIFIFTWPK
ncbi:MAG: PAS domain S-box protein [Candidatus Paracaedibacteraceae bacterium]|nr:PAS domain S-box protein [Candidatus Paracaedibacteraceae bacterium]